MNTSEKALARAILGAGMSDRTWSTYWNAEKKIDALVVLGGPDVRDAAYEQLHRPNDTLNVSKFARYVNAAVASWLATDDGQRIARANLRGGAS